MLIESTQGQNPHLNRSKKWLTFVYEVPGLILITSPREVSAHVGSCMADVGNRRHVDMLPKLHRPSTRLK